MSSPELFRAIVYNSARDGNIKRLEVFLENRDPEWLDSCLNGVNNDKPALVVAAREGHLDVVQYLVKKGARPDVFGTVSFDGETIYGSPALWAAAAAGHIEVTKFLVEEAGASLNQTTHTNSTPLRGACYDGHLDIVQYLVEKGADMEIANRHGHTPLMIAAFRQKADVVRYLLEQGANATASSSKGNTALHDAAEANNAEICDLLLKAGATLKQDDFGVCPLMSAAMLGNLDVIPLLLGACAEKRKQRDVIKMLGATLVDKKMDLKGGTDKWREALSMDLGDETQEESQAARLRVAPSVYEYEEIESLADLEEIAEIPDAIRMQALIIRERILGGAHADVHYYLRFRGAVYCDMGVMERCFALWIHALTLQQRYLPPLHMSTMQTLQAFQETFEIALNEHVIHADMPVRGGMAVTGEQVSDVFMRIVTEVEKLAEWGDRPLFEECCGEDHDHDVDAEKQRLLLTALQLLVLINRLSLPLHAMARDRQPHPPSLEECSAKEAYVDVNRFVRACRALHVFPLHLSCQASDRPEANRFPQFYVVERLIRGGASLRQRDTQGNTPLHTLLNTTSDRTSIAKLLIESGAPVLARNDDDKTCLELIKEKMPKLLEQVRIGRHISLVGLAANAVNRMHVDHMQLLPAHMETEMQLY